MGSAQKFIDSKSKTFMKACIISIGEELLIGQTINTNAAWIAAKLNELGIETHEIVVITDSHEEILRSLVVCSIRADLVLITGGLGPTRDDVTKHALCTFFNTYLVINEEVLADVEGYFARLGRTVTDLNREQALVPANAEALRNEFGTAPGIWFRQNGKIYIAMPGVPHEMRAMTEKHVLPALAAMPREQYIIHKSILTQGIGESALAQKISKWEDALPKHIQLAYLPSMGIVKLRLTAKGSNEAFLRKAIDQKTKSLQKIIAEYIWGYDNDTMEKVVYDLMTRQRLTLATAESCTGGYMAHRITSVPGSSNYYKGSIIAYSNTVKMHMLGVKNDDLEEHGAVSRQVAEQMASNLRTIYEVDYAVGITGIAGPGGGSTDKPVGTTWIAISGQNGTVSQKLSLADNRERNIIRATRAAFMMLINQLMK